MHALATSSLRTRPSENWKDGLGDRLGRKCTMRPECMYAGALLIGSSLHAYACLLEIQTATTR